MLHEQIKNGIKEAMMSKDTIRLEVMRGMVSAFMNELVSKNRKPNEILTDEEVIAVITRMSKQRKDSIEQFKAGGREDLVAEEEAQLAIISTYLPKMMDDEEVIKIIKAKKEEMNITDPKEKGKFVGEVMKDLKGKADGTFIKKVVDSLF
jgi:uncharacterized protein YqeY